MKDEQTYDAAMKRYLSRKPKRLKPRGEAYPDRKELHERPGIR